MTASSDSSAPFAASAADSYAARLSRRTHRRGWLVRRALLAADFFGLAFAFVAGPPSAYVACQLVIPGTDVGRVSALAESLLFVLVLPLWAFAAKVYGLYD